MIELVDVFFVVVLEFVILKEKIEWWESGGFGLDLLVLGFVILGVDKIL